MSDAPNAEFDPRFDPAFQRGFDTSIPVAESVPAPTSRVEAAAAPVSAPPVARPAGTPSATPPVTTAAAPAIAREPAAAPIEDDGDLLDDRALLLDATAEPVRTRNPFLIAILAVAIILLAGGIVLLTQLGDAFNSSQVRSQGDYDTLTSLINFSPYVSLLGAATAVGLLFFLAREWRRRH